MFGHIGHDADPHHGRRLAVATALTFAGGAGVVGGAQALGIGLAAMISLFGRAEPPIEPLPALTEEELYLVEVILADPALTEADLPEPPPLVPPEPPPEEAPGEDPSEDAVVDAASEDMDEAVKELEEPEPDDGSDEEAPEDPDTDEVVEEELSEEGKLARQERLDVMERARAEGLLGMGELDFDRKALDPGWVDDGLRWDGLFGPRDSHLLVAALRDGRVDTWRAEAVAANSGISMSHASFGMGGGWGGPAMRLPPQRDLIEAALPRFPRRLRKELGDAVDCLLRVTVDGRGHLEGVVIVDCPEPLHALAMEAAHESLWAESPDASSATIGHTVEFRK